MVVRRGKPRIEKPYPTTDGKPMAETDRHRRLSTNLIDTLDLRFEPDPNVYISGNLLIFYSRGNRRKHISPDVFVVKGVPKRERLNYLIWTEGKGPDAAIELTSSSTRHVDTKRKFELYRDILKIKEYFLFDPFDDYLVPRLQGFRLRAGDYLPIKMASGRMHSEVLELDLAPVLDELRLFDPTTGKRIATPLEERQEALDRIDRAEIEKLRAQAELDRAQAALEAVDAARIKALAEVDRLRERLRTHGLNGGNGNAT